MSSAADAQCLPRASGQGVIVLGECPRAKPRHRRERTAQLWPSKRRKPVRGRRPNPRPRVTAIEREEDAAKSGPQPPSLSWGFLLASCLARLCVRCFRGDGAGAKANTLRELSTITMARRRNHFTSRRMSRRCMPPVFLTMSGSWPMTSNPPKRSYSPRATAPSGPLCTWRLSAGRPHCLDTR